MNPAEIVVGEVERQGCIEVFPFLAESVSQAGEPLASLAQRSVLTFNV